MQQPNAANTSAMAQKLANHQTPLIRNSWYVAGRSEELGRQLLGRKLLGTNVVMYRTEDGQPVILDDRCVHRSFPLSKGRLRGDEVVCGYHGMAYNPSGQCVDMPSLAKPPTHACVKSYPVVEKSPLIWIWMGDPALAEERDIPELEWLDSPDWKTVTGNFNFHTNYVAMHENLLDQTHFPILHAGTVGTPEYSRAKLEVTQEGDQVIENRELLDSEPPSIYGIPMGLMERKVDRYSHAYFMSPAGHVAHARIVNRDPKEGENKEYKVNITHLFTPEDQNNLHYWWFNSRDFDHSNSESDEFLFEASKTAYYEDVEALTWIQDNLDKESGPVEELSFGPDRPGLLMRKILLKLAKAEQGQ